MALKLQELGFRNVYVLKGGWNVWKDGGWPLELKEAVPAQ